MKPPHRRWDQIYIQDLLVRCIVGLYDWERTEKQDVIINITLHADLRQAGRTDRIEDTVDYKDTKKRIVALVEMSQFKLVEALAAAVANVCLTAAGVEAVDVRIDKPGALRFARSVAIEIHREKAATG